MTYFESSPLLISRLFFSILHLGEFHETIDFDERIRRLQNDFGVDVLFTWGIIEQEGKNRDSPFKKRQLSRNTKWQKVSKWHKAGTN